MKYSTIMPVYNAGNKLEKSIESIIYQTYSNWELIIIDDGSTDNSLEICKKYSKNDKRIKVIHQTNHGPGYARNVGIKKATGDYITFLDADDYYSNDFYETISKSNSDMIFYGIIKENNEGKIHDYINIFKYKKYNKEELIKLQLMGILSWGAWRKAIKTSIAKKSLFNDLDVGEEVLFSFNTMLNSKNIDFLDKYLYHHVFNNDGQHLKGGIDPWRNVARIVKNDLVLNNYYKKYEYAINGLAFRGLCIAIKRICLDNNLKDSKKVIKNYINEYKQEFEIYKIEKNLLDKTSKIIMLLVKFKLYFLLFIGTKIKYRK